MNIVRTQLGVCQDTNFPDREQNDFYATSPQAAEWLIKIEDLSPNIWECACGQGHLSKVFVNNGFNVKSTDLIDRGYGTSGVDFLTCTDKFDGDIITNPPFKYAEDFIKHSLDLIPDGNKVCMFLKVQFMEGIKRRKLFDEYPPARVWVSSHRIPCFKSGAECGWGGWFPMLGMCGKKAIQVQQN